MKYLVMLTVLLVFIIVALFHTVSYWEIGAFLFGVLIGGISGAMIGYGIGEQKWK